MGVVGTVAIGWVQDGRVTSASERVEAVYRARGAKLWRALLAFTSDPDLASDALAEAFAQVLARRDAIHDPEAWVWRSSFRIAAGELKERGRHSTAVVEPPSYELPDGIPPLVAALRRISPNQRLAVVLHDYADRPVGEVADILGCSRATVHVHLSQGRRRLRTLLEANDE
jgi:RNA polymerase sigma-70 factor (ECF subfamily)